MFYANERCARIYLFQYITVFMDYTADFYSQPSYRGGASFPIFTGSIRQRGGGIFGSLGKILAVTKRVGKKLLSHGVGLARDVAQDVMSGQNIKESLINRGKSPAMSMGR